MTDEEKTAINWIKMARGKRGENRKTLNDILVDALWYFLEVTEGKGRDDIRAMIPSPQRVAEALPTSKVTEMRKLTKKGDPPGSAGMAAGV